MDKRLLSIKELSEYLSVKPNTIYSWISLQKIPFKKLGRLVRFSVEEIDEWIKKNSIDTYPIR